MSFLFGSFINFLKKKNTRIPGRLLDGCARASSVYIFHLNFTFSNSLNYSNKIYRKFSAARIARAATNAMPNPIFRYQTKPFVTKLRCKWQLLCDFCNIFYLRPVCISLCHSTDSPLLRVFVHQFVILENIKSAHLMPFSFHSRQQ